MEDLVGGEAVGGSSFVPTYGNPAILEVKKMGWPLLNRWRDHRDSFAEYEIDVPFVGQPFAKLTIVRLSCYQERDVLLKLFGGMLIVWRGRCEEQK